MDTFKIRPQMQLNYN